MTVSSNLSSFLKVLSSYNSNVLLVALVFLLLVILFVLILHFYARFFWSDSSDQQFSIARRRRRRRRNRRRTVTTTRIIPSVPLGGFDGGEVSTATAATSDDKGLDSSVISSIPLFVYEEDEKEEEEEECVICLGLWEVGDFGRKLRNCGHGFHVDCIDMWLSSHSSCPLCRSPVLAASVQDNLIKPAFNVVEEEEEEEREVRLQLFPAGEEDENVAGDRRVSVPPFGVVEDDLKTGVDDGDGVGEGEVRIEVFAGDESEINNGGSSRGDRKSSASSSLKRMLSSSSSNSRSRSERNKVFPSARQDSSL